MITLAKAKTFKKNLKDKRLLKKLKAMQDYILSGEWPPGQKLTHNAYVEYGWMYAELRKSYINDVNALVKAAKLVNSAVTEDPVAVTELVNRMDAILTERINKGEVVHVDFLPEDRETKKKK